MRSGSPQRLHPPVISWGLGLGWHAEFDWIGTHDPTPFLAAPAGWAFIEQALNVKGKRNYSLRDYFLSEFYADHVKRYKKRPIYWLFSSPKGSFNALIYMHRYRPDTVSVVLKYLRDYREKLSTEKDRQASVSINPATSPGDKTRALKEADRLAKVLAELEDYERDVLYPLATERTEHLAIDLDDGVKKNYLKLNEHGPVLKKITGLDGKEED